MFKIIIINIIIILLNLGFVFGQQMTLRPTLVAIHTPDLEKSIVWYQNNLGFQLKSRQDFPDYKLKIAILKQDGFELELVEIHKTGNRKNPLHRKNKLMQGFAKLTFEVEDLHALFNKFIANKVGIVMSITRSNREDQANIYFFMIHDVDGNLLQFISKSKFD